MITHGAEQLLQSHLQVGVDDLAEEVVLGASPQAVVNSGVSTAKFKVCCNGSAKPLEKLGRAIAEVAPTDGQATD